MMVRLQEVKLGRGTKLERYPIAVHPNSVKQIESAYGYNYDSPVSRVTVRHGNDVIDIYVVGSVEEVTDTVDKAMQG